jgi:uncharacterized protein with PIN domain
MTNHGELNGTDGRRGEDGTVPVRTRCSKCQSVILFEDPPHNLALPEGDRFGSEWVPCPVCKSARGGSYPLVLDETDDATRALARRLRIERGMRVPGEPRGASREALQASMRVEGIKLELSCIDCNTVVNTTARPEIVPGVDDDLEPDQDRIREYPGAMHCPSCATEGAQIPLIFSIPAGADFDGWEVRLVELIVAERRERGIEPIGSVAIWED